MVKTVFLILLIVLATGLWVPITYAAENLTEKTHPPLATTESDFATSYDVVYDVSEDGITTVTEKITLRNLTSKYYANQFKLIIGATQISDIKASDSTGPLEVGSQQKDNSTIISIKFNKQVAGLNKSYPFTVQFKSKDFSEKQGKVWEVRAPKTSSVSNLENYNLTISVPVSFGEPTLISPTPKSQTTSFGKIFLTYDKSQLQLSGVSATFGNSQLFDFDIDYHLENKNLTPVVTSIALPPDTQYQDVIYQRLDPNPVNVTVDEDGNYLAWYRLKRGQKTDVKLIGSAKLYTNSKVENSLLDQTLRKKYTQSKKYWEKDNPQIQSKLAEILGENPPDSKLEKVRLIYRYVVDNLRYDSSRITDNIDRLGAVTALNNPDSAVCMEFTDLFIALTRAAGIPARELNGFAYSSNTKIRPNSLTRDVLHSWPEFWDDKRGWVMVDPTWENTTGGVDYFNKLDLNHFVFAIKGVSSEQPVPAGSYKFKGSDSQDIKVSLSENDFLGKPQIDTNFEVSDPILAGFPSKLKIKVSNFGNAIFYPSDFKINAGKLNLLGAQTNALGLIPAFGFSVIEYNIRTGSLFDSYQDNIELSLNDQKITKTVTVKPFMVFQNIPAAILTAWIFIVIIYVLTLGGFIHKNRKKKVPK